MEEENIALVRVLSAASQIGNGNLSTVIGKLCQNIKQEKQFECVWDPATFNRTVVNNSYCNTFRLKRSDLEGQSIYSLTSEGDKKNVQAYIQHMLASKLPQISTEDVSVNGVAKTIRWIYGPRVLRGEVRPVGEQGIAPVPEHGLDHPADHHAVAFRHVLVVAERPQLSFLQPEECEVSTRKALDVHVAADYPRKHFVRRLV